MTQIFPNWEAFLQPFGVQGYLISPFVFSSFDNEGVSSFDNESVASLKEKKKL